MKNSEECFFSVMFRDLELVKKEYEWVKCWHFAHFHEICQKVPKLRSSVDFSKKSLAWASIWEWAIQRNAFFQSCSEILNLWRKKRGGEMLTSSSSFTKYVKKCKNEISVIFKEILVLRINLQLKNSEEMLFSVHVSRSRNLWRRKQEGEMLISCSFSRNVSKSAEIEIFVISRKILCLSF